MVIKGTSQPDFYPTGFFNQNFVLPTGGMTTITPIATSATTITDTSLISIDNFNESLWQDCDISMFDPTATRPAPTVLQKDTATSEYFKLPPQSRLRQVVLASVEHSWIKCCEENNVCVDYIFGSCSRTNCPLTHVAGFKKEHLFYRTERCREGERCSHKKTNCRFWHPEGTEPRRTAQENILFALRRRMDSSPPSMLPTFEANNNNSNNNNNINMNIPITTSTTTPSIGIQKSPSHYNGQMAQNQNIQSRNTNYPKVHPLIHQMNHNSLMSVPGPMMFATKRQ